jgi:hypothetical protein
LGFESTFPFERLAHDLVDIDMLRLPAETLPDAVGARDEGGRVPRPTARQANREIDARNFLHGLDDLEDGKSPAITAIAGQALPTFA